MQPIMTEQEVIETFEMSGLERRKGERGSAKNIWVKDGWWYVVDLGMLCIYHKEGIAYTSHQFVPVEKLRHHDLMQMLTSEKGGGLPALEPDGD